MTGFVPPPYPYDRLNPLKEIAAASSGGLLDLSIGTPCDEPPEAVMAALADVAAAQRYPPSIGTADYHDAVRGWLERRFAVAVEPVQVAACIGSKELVAGLPHWLRLRRPDRDTVLYPAISYPTYAMGARLAGCRAVPVPLDDAGRLVLDEVDEIDAARAVCLWSNSPGNPTGCLDDLGAAAAWGRARDVPVLSDECYAEFTWDGPARSILQDGTDGVLAIHSLSKRSNLAGARVGFYAGDGDLVGYLSEVRKHAGFMVPGPVQRAGAAAWADDAHVTEQRDRYRERLELLTAGMIAMGFDATFPDGAFYLWLPAPDGDAWTLAHRLACAIGMLVSPGEFYGPDGADHVRIAAVAPVDAIKACLASR